MEHYKPTEPSTNPETTLFTSLKASMLLELWMSMVKSSSLIDVMLTRYREKVIRPASLSAVTYAP